MVLDEKIRCSYFKCRQELPYGAMALGILPDGKMLSYCDSVCASFARVEEYKNIEILFEMPERLRKILLK